MPKISAPPRVPWDSFPDVLIHSSESVVKQHPAYKAAKAGDGLAALVLVNDTMSDAAVSLTGKPHSAKLAPTPERLQELRAKHGTELEHWWIEQFAHAFDALTESEARYLARTETLDTIRNRIAAIQ